MTQGRVRVATIIALFVLLAASCGLLYRNLVQTQAQLDNTRSDLAVARQSIIDEQRKGREAKDRIDALDKDVARVNGELSATQDRLNTANSTIEKRDGDVSAMKRCLDGITSAVVSASTRNTAEAENTLSGAKGDCDRAYATA